MKKEELFLKSFIDEVPISVLVITPEVEPKGIVQIVHGMVDHKERYLNFMEFLASQGFIAIASDVRGHGKSIKEKNDLGYFYNDGANSAVEDVHQVSLYIKDKYPNLNLSLFGHSMGSLIVRNYIKKYDNEIRELIVCGSPSYNNSVEFALSIIKILKKIKGDRYRSKTLKNICFNGFNKDLPGNNKYKWICSNEEIVKLYENDPLCNYIFTLNGFESLFNLMKEAYSKEGWNVKNPELPIMFISGEDDRTMVTYDKWIDAQNLLKEIGYKNVTNKLYEKYRHEILNEVDNDKIYLDIIEFISK